MGRQNLAFLAFNRGLIDPRGLARADIKRVALSAETMTNWIPRVLGSMMLRPGLKYVGATRTNLAARFVPFIFSATDKALLEFTDSRLRVWINDVLITRPAVTTAVAGGTFPSAASLAANWTDNDQAGATSAWISAGLVGFTGTGTNAAIRDQVVTVAVADQNVEHALNIVIARGPLTLRVGSTVAGDEYITETELGTGQHSLAVTPTGDINIRFMSRYARIVHLQSCDVAAAGVMALQTPWAQADLGVIRYDQSADVVFVACDGYQQERIERRGARSWSSVRYLAPDGPFRVENTGPITMTPSVLTGNGTLTASATYFRSDLVGALFAVTSTGQTVTKSMVALNDATSSIKLTGVDAVRVFTITLTGLTGTGNTVVLQRSFDNAAWVAVATKSWTANTSETFDDGLDNQIVYYRLLCTVYVGGTTAATLQIATGSITGVGRVTAYTSGTVVSVEVLTDFGGTSATDTWAEGQWSSYRGYPSSVVFHEGRLWWAGRDKVNGSVSDAFDSFDLTIEGDAGPILRSIGAGPVDTINWLLALQRLVLGAQGAEFSCRSSSLDEPLTPTNFNIKPASTQGSAAVGGVKIDANGIYVQRGGTRVFELAISGETYDYASTNLSALVPAIGSPGIVRIAVQRQPDTRVHFVRSDGTVALLVFDRVENVICWLNITSPGATGLIEDVVVLPGDAGADEDQIYYVVKRTVNGTTVRHLEKFALESEAIGGTLNKQADSFITFTNPSPSAVVTGLTHLVGASVVVWADGKCLDDAAGDIATFTVSGAGEITVTDGGSAYLATTGVVGLAYTSQWKSGKLVQLQAMLGTPLLQEKIIKGLGLIMQNVHPKGLKYGRTFATADLQNLPEIEMGTTVAQDTVRSTYDQPIFVFPGGWGTDERLCLQGAAPRPVTILAGICDTEMHE